MSSLSRPQSPVHPPTISGAATSIPASRSSISPSRSPGPLLGSSAQFLHSLIRLLPGLKALSVHPRRPPSSSRISSAADSVSKVRPVARVASVGHLPAHLWFLSLCIALAFGLCRIVAMHTLATVSRQPFRFIPPLAYKMRTPSLVTQNLLVDMRSLPSPG